MGTGLPGASKGKLLDTPSPLATGHAAVLVDEGTPLADRSAVACTASIDPAAFVDPASALRFEHHSAEGSEVEGGLDETVEVFDGEDGFTERYVADRFEGLGAPESPAFAATCSITENRSGSGLTD